LLNVYYVLIAYPECWRELTAQGLDVAYNNFVTAGGWLKDAYILVWEIPYVDKKKEADVVYLVIDGNHRVEVLRLIQYSPRYLVS
jgi:hypothetical protein